MFRKITYVLFILFSVSVLVSCGGGGSDDVETVSYNRLKFDTAESNMSIPFPNDVMWQETEGIVDLTDQAENASETALYSAIKALNIKGLSPNTPIAIPLASDIKLSSTSLYNSIRIFDLTGYQVNPTANNFFTDIEIKQNGNIINVYPLNPMAAGHRYLVIITGDLKDYRGYPVMPSPIYKTLRDTDNCSTLDSPDLQNLCSSYDPLWDMAANLTGKKKENLLEIFTFTTADKTLGLEDFGVISATVEKPSLLDNYGNLITGYKYSDLDSDSDLNEYVGADALSELPLLCQNLYIQNPTLLPAVTDGSTYFKSPNLYELASIQAILGNYNFPDNQSNYGAVCTSIFDNSSLYDNVTMETAVNTETPNGIVLFQHGLGGSKSNVDLIADEFSSYMVVSMDLPWHGGRVLNADLPDTDCDETQSGSCYLTDNPIYDRLNIYQSLLDMHTLTKMFGLQAVSQGLPLYFAGQSMGAITGSMLMNVDNITTSNVALQATEGQKAGNFINKGLLNVGGGNYAALLNEATNDLITGLLDTLGVEKHSIEYYTTLGVFQLLLDPVDPAYFADNTAISGKVLLQSANHDTVIPNASNKVLAHAYNFDPGLTITGDDTAASGAIASPSAGWYMFGSGDNWVNHGFLLSTSNLNDLYPEAFGYLNQTYVENMQGLAITQALNFLSTQPQ
ncbi:Ig-like domain-containing protein [Flexistipes sinusarabici]|uniref:Ig-like domain-containing protein n=1 Tax=Flexistipes sinusarabici TaxID=2352 RepID=UPI00235677BA|nr:Ig-like domain-containing protein [Flexistipes sinusarabici]